MVQGRLWNIGAKTGDMRADLHFFEQLGGEVLLHEMLSGPDGDSEYALLNLCGTRILLTPEPLYEGKLAEPLRAGLAHAVFEVDDLDGEYARLVAQGTEVLIEPALITAGFGTRRIAFFRSPGGLIFEVMQVLESKV